MEQENRPNDRSNVRREPVFSMKLRAGRKRTYFFDIRPTRSNDYYLTITESKKKFNEDGYERHKIFIYKEDFNRFIDMLNQTVNHVKTELLPDYDFDEFNRSREYRQDRQPQTPPANANLQIEDVKFDDTTGSTNGNDDAKAAPSKTDNPDAVESESVENNEDEQTGHATPDNDEKW